MRALGSFTPADDRWRLFSGVYAADAQCTLPTPMHAADACLMLGLPDSARAPLAALQKEFPDSRTIAERLEALDR